MASSEPNVLVVLRPNADKQGRVEETITKMTSAVKEKEPWVSNYDIYRILNQGENKDITDYLILIHLDDMSQFEKRMGLDHHQQVRKDNIEQNMLRQPLQYAKLEKIEGFTR